jgi:uncharacterized membrane protein
MAIPERRTWTWIIVTVIGLLLLMAGMAFVDRHAGWLRILLVFAAALGVVCSLGWLSGKFYASEQDRRQKRLLRLLAAIIVLVGMLALLLRWLIRSGA